MTKQEEIRAVIRGYVDLAQGYTEGSCPIEAITDNMVKHLHSQGVVIKVDRELPRDFPTDAGHAFEKVVQGNMLKAGYVAVEPLIKE